MCCNPFETEVDTYVVGRHVVIHVAYGREVLAYRGVVEEASTHWVRFVTDNTHRELIINKAYIVQYDLLDENPEPNQ